MSKRDIATIKRKQWTLQQGKIQDKNGRLVVPNRDLFKLLTVAEIRLNITYVNVTQELTKRWLNYLCLFALYTSLNAASQAIWRNLLLNQLQPMVSLCMWKLTQPTLEICLVHVPQVIIGYFTSTTITANILGTSHWCPKHASRLYKHRKMYLSRLDFQRHCIAIMERNLQGKESKNSVIQIPYHKSMVPLGLPQHRAWTRQSYFQRKHK